MKKIKMNQKPVRPLGEISDFVLEKLPEYTQKIFNIDGSIKEIKLKNGGVSSLENEKISVLNSYVSEIEELYSNFSRLDIEKSINSASFRTVILDVKMCVMFMYYNGIFEIPKNVLHAIDMFNGVTGDVRIHTYQDLILENPIYDMRTYFPKNGIGKSEELFYTTHNLIEKEIMSALVLIKNAISIQFISQENVSEIEKKMKDANILAGKLYGSLPKEDFLIFRRYLGSVEKFNIRGPSGAFSGTYPLIDLYWRGKNNIFKENLERYKVDNIYFPTFQRAEIMKLSKHDSASVLSLAKSGAEGFRDLYMVLFEVMKKFRHAHLSGVKKHLPEVYGGTAGGTMQLSSDGDSATVSFLKGSLKNTKDSKM